MLALEVQRGWRKGAVKELCRNLSPRDRDEARFTCNNLERHIAEVLDDMGDDCVSIYDHNGRLWWLGGIAPSHIPDHEADGFAWLLKTKYAKPKRMSEKLVMRAALNSVIQLCKDKTDYRIVGNIIWDQQKKNIRWLESCGFYINRGNPGVLTQASGKTGVFYQFNKNIRGDDNGT